MVKKMSTYQKIVSGFVCVILVGSFLLSLPFFQQAQQQSTYLDHLFTVTLMVSVTGLSTVVVSQTYNTFGQIIGMVLIQIGGLGWMSVVSVLAMNARNKLSLTDKYFIQESIGYQSVFKVQHVVKRIVIYTVLVELCMASLLAIDFIPRYGFFKGILNSLFIAVSAFCNAGFDNLGSNSLQSFITHPLVNIVVILLIILGGVGFSVCKELLKAITALYYRQRIKFSHHVMLVLQTTALLLLFGTVMTLCLEYNNPQTLGQLNFFEKLQASLFQSTTMRTAGFASIDYNYARPLTNFVYILLMFIGGAPGGTAGGIKVTTFAIFILIVISTMKGNESVVYKHRTIPINILKKALVIVIFYILILMIGIGVLLLSEPHIASSRLLFEAVSALSTTGVSMGITSQLSEFGKIIIILLMFIGRVGPITVLTSLVIKKSKDIKYSKVDIMIG